MSKAKKKVVAKKSKHVPGTFVEKAAKPQVIGTGKKSMLLRVDVEFGNYVRSLAKKEKKPITDVTRDLVNSGVLP